MFEINFRKEIKFKTNLYKYKENIAVMILL